MKRLLLVILISLTFFTGCGSYSPFSRMEQRIMVQLVGIDFEDGLYTVSIQFSMGKSSNAMEVENDLKTITGKGVNLYSAVREAQKSVGKELFFSHTQVVFLGKSVLNNNPIEVLEDYLTYCDHHSTAYVAGAYEKAEDILSLTYKDEYSDKNKLFLVLKNAKETGIYPAYIIYESQINAYNKSNSFFVPMIRVEEAKGGDSGEEETKDNSENEDNGETGDDSNKNSTGIGGDTEHPKVIPEGGVLINDGKIKAFMSESRCAGLAMIANTCKTLSIDFESGSEIRSIRTFKKKVKIKPIFDGENLTFDIRFSATVQGDSNSKISRAVIDNYTDDFVLPAQNAIKAKMRDTVDFAVGLGCDVFNLEDALKHYDYPAWLKTEDDWKQILKNAKFTYNVVLTVI